MANYEWDDLNEIYVPPEQAISKGTSLTVQISCMKPIGTLNVQILESFFGSWTYPHGGKYIKPFKLLEFTSDETWLSAKVSLITKSKEVDELKMLLQDVLHFLNSDHIKVSRIDVTLL